MSAANGHAHENGGPMTSPPTALEVPVTSPHSMERVTELVAALEVPFDPAQIEWRVTNTTQNQQPVRGQAIPYADQRAYTDRLNALLTPAGWTRRYRVHTSANFERAKDKGSWPRCSLPANSRSLDLVRTQPLARNGRTTIMPARRPRRRHSSAPALALGSAVTGPLHRNMG